MYRHFFVSSPLLLQTEDSNKDSKAGFGAVVGGRRGFVGRGEGCRGERGGVVDETYISGRHRETWMDKTRMPVNRNIFSLV
jgi:hypothetical protein